MQNVMKLERTAIRMWLFQTMAQCGEWLYVVAEDFKLE
jgi:hypothetical protein